MKLSEKRKADKILRARYMAIIEKDIERPWDERSDRILELFFLTDKPYRKIGDEIGISEGRVRQLITTQVRRLLHPLWLEQYWNPDYDPDNKLVSDKMNIMKIKLEQQYGSSQNWPIKEMPFLPRTRNNLLRANINTVGQLVNRFSTIPNIKMLGPKALKDIDTVLKALSII